MSWFSELELEEVEKEERLYDEHIRCSTCTYKAHCDETSDLYGVPRYNGGCKYWERK